MPSHKVQLKRKANNTNLPNEVYAESKRKVGSVMTASGDIYTGLSRDQIKKWMPEILGIDTSDVGFFKQVKEYFKNYTIEVPLAGLDLDVGLDKTGEPENLFDYIKYKFVLGHPDVAAEQSLAKGKSFKYFLNDTAKEKTKVFNALAIKKKAYKEFIKLSGDDKKMDMVLRLYFKNPTKMDAEDKELYLESQADKEPAEFYMKVSDKNLETNAFIEECLTAQVLRRVGNALLLGDDKIGDDTEEAILYLKDAKNSATIVNIKAQLKAYNM